MPDADKLTLTDPSDFAAGLAFALSFHGRKRVHSADEIMAEIVARLPVEHLERAGLVVMKRPTDVAPRRWDGDSKANQSKRVSAAIT